jgi:hypothetical protein
MIEQTIARQNRKRRGTGLTISVLLSEFFTRRDPDVRVVEEIKEGHRSGSVQLRYALWKSL